MRHFISGRVSIEAIKRVAKSIKKVEGIQHAAALNRASQRFGFSNFRHAQSSLKNMEQSAEATTAGIPVTVSAYWYDVGAGLRGRESLTAMLSAPWHELIRPSQINYARGLARMRPDQDGRLSREDICRSQFDARSAVCHAIRTLQFIDATRLRPSLGFSKAYPSELCPDAARIPGEDHADVWFDSKRRYLITDEPYQARAVMKEGGRKSWLAQYGYTSSPSTWPGMHNPYGGTGLILVTHAVRGIPLGPLLEALNKLPAPPSEYDWKGDTIVIPRPIRAPRPSSGSKITTSTGQVV